jgi:alkylation response protein AidB-like acyl-CoA dehydrogenase
LVGARKTKAMDFSLTPEQQLLQRTARDVLAAIAPMSHVRAMMADARGTTDAVWRQIAELGWPGLLVAEEYGGAGLGMLELAIVLEEMGRVAMPGPFLSTVVGGRVIAVAGDEEQRRRWLPGICDGSCIATFALLETDARWDLEGVTAVARPVAGGWTLAGRKLFVPDAHVADLVVCAVRRADDGEPVFAVLTPDPAKLTALPSVDGTHKIFALDLDDVRVAADCVLAGDAAATLAAVLDEARVALAAEMTGGAARVLDMTVEHVKVRQQFGQPIGAFQAVQHACADMMVAVECAKAATTYAAWAVGERAEDAPAAAATAKATAGEAFRAVTTKAVQLHGGIGFTWEHDLHIYYKRAMSGEVTFGDATWSRELIAQAMGL